MKDTHRTYIEELKQDIRVFERLLRRAKERVEEAEPWAKPEWSIEVDYCESRLNRFRDTLHIAEENFAPS
jgi:hypothetical protein